jgi:hypothetical protein
LYHEIEKVTKQNQKGKERGQRSRTYTTAPTTMGNDRALAISLSPGLLLDRSLYDIENGRERSRKSDEATIST